MDDQYMAADPGARQQLRRMRARCLLLAIVAAAAVLLAILGEPLVSIIGHGGNGQPRNTVVIRLLLCLGGIAAGLFTCAVAARIAVLTRAQPASVRIPAIADTSLAALRPAASDLARHRLGVQQKYFNEAVLLFAGMLINPEYRLRLVETFNIRGDTASTRSTADFVLQPGEPEKLRDRGQVEGPQGLAIPLLWLPKGTLIDDLVITDARGVRLMTLPRTETTALIGLTIGSLFNRAFATGPLHRDERLAAALDGVYRLLAIRDRVDEAQVADAVDALFDGLEPIEYHPFGVLRRLVVQSATEYVLAVEAPLPVGYALSISYTSSVSIRNIARAGLTGTVASLIGLEPCEFEIPVRAASLFDNYHAELDGRNREQYVRSQQVVYRDGTDPARPHPRPAEELFTEEGTQDPRHRAQLRWQNDSGDGYPHLHIINYGYLSKPLRLGWRVRLTETPPGNLGPVIGLSFTVTLVAVVFAIAAATMTKPDLNAPALVLAIPVIVITVFGFSFSSLQRSPLTAVVGLLGSAALAVLTALSLLTLREVGPGEAQNWVYPWATLFGQQVHVLTGLCALGAMALTAVLVVVLSARLAAYREHQRRNSARRQ